MLCRPGMRPPVSEEPGTTVEIGPKFEAKLVLGRLSGVRRPPRGRPTVAGPKIKPSWMLTITGGRSITVEPLRKLFVMTAGASRTAAAAAGRFPACTAVVTATALE